MQSITETSPSNAGGVSQHQSLRCRGREPRPVPPMQGREPALRSQVTSLGLNPEGGGRRALQSAFATQTREARRGLGAKPPEKKSKMKKLRSAAKPVKDGSKRPQPPMQGA